MSFLICPCYPLKGDDLIVEPVANIDEHFLSFNFVKELVIKSGIYLHVLILNEETVVELPCPLDRAYPVLASVHEKRRHLDLIGKPMDIGEVLQYLRAQPCRNMPVH